MTNIDLVQAIEMVVYYRRNVDALQEELHDCDAYEVQLALDHNVESLYEAENELASLMIALREGYDLALLPKVDFPEWDDLVDIPF